METFSLLPETWPFHMGLHLPCNHTTIMWQPRPILHTSPETPDTWTAVLRDVWPVASSAGTPTSWSVPGLDADTWVAMSVALIAGRSALTCEWSLINKALLDKCYKFLSVFKGGHVAEWDTDWASWETIYQILLSPQTWPACDYVCVRQRGKSRGGKSWRGMGNEQGVGEGGGGEGGGGRGRGNWHKLWDLPLQGSTEVSGVLFRPEWNTGSHMNAKFKS